ncbi:MAG: hypothetical protein ACREOW_17890 [Thermodesulfobacteriota bacterium]
MVNLVSHIEGRTRLKFQDLYEKNLFLENIKNISGLQKLEHNGEALTVLVKYEPNSQIDYIIKNMISKEPETKLANYDVSHYVTPLLKSPLTKALWLIAILGYKVGFLQFAISTMIVNRYIRAKFG